MTTEKFDKYIRLTPADGMWLTDGNGNYSREVFAPTEAAASVWHEIPEQDVIEPTDDTHDTPDDDTPDAPDSSTPDADTHDGDEPTPDASSLYLDIAQRVADIDNYDTSDNVNIFYINDAPMWLAQEKRLALKNSLQLCKESNESTYRVWYNGLALDLPVEQGLQMIDAIERYAMQCLAVTEQHKYDVLQLTTVADVESYDITAGYPDALHFTL